MGLSWSHKGEAYERCSENGACKNYKRCDRSKGLQFFKSFADQVYQPIDGEWNILLQAFHSLFLYSPSDNSSRPHVSGKFYTDPWKF